MNIGVWEYSAFLCKEEITGFRFINVDTNERGDKTGKH
jgi:hypothetical protein